MTKNDAIKFAATHYPFHPNLAIDIAAKLNELDDNWPRFVGEGYTVKQLSKLVLDLQAGKEHKTMPRDPEADITPPPAEHSHEETGIVEGVFSIKEHDFQAQPVDVVTFKGHPPKSVFYLAKICRNCGVGMVISFEQIPKDVQQISAAMLTLERVFYKAGHEDAKL